jgi:hypothetical protein
VQLPLRGQFRKQYDLLEEEHFLVGQNLWKGEEILG